MTPLRSCPAGCAGLPAPGSGSSLSFELSLECSRALRPTLGGAAAGSRADVQSDRRRVRDRAHGVQRPNKHPCKRRQQQSACATAAAASFAGGQATCSLAGCRWHRQSSLPQAHARDLMPSSRAAGRPSALHAADGRSRHR
eukprot:351952-Chlamydomonas_euryale.AAC.11